MDRRQFARTVTTLIAGLGLTGAGWRGARRSRNALPARRLSPSSIPTRRLGRTGLDVPILSLGGHHLGRAGSERDARRLVDIAIEGW